MSADYLCIEVKIFNTERSVDDIVHVLRCEVQDLGDDFEIDLVESAGLKESS